jgi:PAS domain S-box-containing protein
VLAQAHQVLEPVARSAGEARSLVRRVLVEGRHEQWIDSAELAVSELVSNAVLHAHTPIELSAVLTPSRLRVEVRDESSVMPVARDWGAEAPTGRGISLVAAITTEHGVVPLQPCGKLVWFCLDDRAEARADLGFEALLDLWDDDPSGSAVLLRDFPPALWLAAREHHDAILRDLVLHLARRPRGTLAEAAVASADLARLTVSASLDQLLAQHDPVPHDLDLEVVVPADRRDCFSVLQDVLDEAERLATAGQLLVRPALPEVVAVRDWVCEQVIAQGGGAPPAPWAGTAAPWFTGQATEAGLPVWDTTEVARSADLVVAADDANRVIAVSRPLADLLAWEPDELVGRRLVTLIPPRLREAHVAGFTRYLATGQHRVLGAPVEVFVLRADGTELPARLLIEERHSQDGRTVFVACFELP